MNAVLPAIDARMGEVYWGRLARDKDLVEGWAWRDEARVSTPAAVPALVADEIGVGSGWDGYSDAFGLSQTNDPQRWLPDRCPRASDIARIACRCFDSGVVNRVVKLRRRFTSAMLSHDQHNRNSHVGQKFHDVYPQVRWTVLLVSISNLLLTLFQIPNSRQRGLWS